MLTLCDVRLRRGPQVLFEHAELRIFAGEKLGVVGRNGCGKSSLLALVRGELTPDAGEFHAAPGLRMASVAQELPDCQTSLAQHVLEGDLELRELVAEIARTPPADGMRLSMLHAEYERAGGYSAGSRAAELAAGLGFEPKDLERPIREFSGGLKMRANLARALMRRSDVLLLDEPTNHLDLDALLWLEQWLREYQGTLLLVCHDREFLDRVVTRIVHIGSARLRAYAGNYSAFETQHAAELERTHALIEKREREIERVHRFVERFRAKASKARQAQSRLKWLARLETIAPIHIDADFDWRFDEPAKLPRPLLALERVAAGYGTTSVLNRVSLTLSPGDRIGVLGRNGAGKSTLMRTLAGTLEPLGGTISSSPDVVTGFFAQMELERLDGDSTALRELVRLGGPEAMAWTEQRSRDHLGRFGFRGERVFDSTRQFSGGERARLALAILVARRPNLLLLDEPTNHLDFEMRHVLMLALQEFEGAVVVVSHDRALLAGTCDRFVLVANGAVSPFEGSIDDYAQWLRGAGARRAAIDTAERDTPPSRREQRRQEAEARNRLSALRTEQRSIETSLEELSRRREQLEQAFADPELYAMRSVEERHRLAREHGEICAEIASLESRWIQLGEALEGVHG